MQFNSAIFLFVFLPLTVLVFETVPPRARLIVLAVASSVFYAYNELKPFIFLCLSVGWVFAATNLDSQKHRGAIIFLATAFPVVVLVLFKYLGFILDNVGVTPIERRSFSFFLDVAVPAGISFYSLQLIGYAVDVLTGKVPVERDALKLFTFASFFPQLVAGPIVRYEAMRYQLYRLCEDRKLSRDYVGAFSCLATGVFAKVFLADILSKISSKVPAVTGMSGYDTWVSVTSYSLYIYYDFYAYSIMAIGLGKLFGIVLPLNFNAPYLAQNPRDFWRRWHITLSTWLRDYIFIPLGGRQAGLRNIVIVFAVCGMWHGAAWNFVVWGLYHATLMVTYYLTRAWWDRIPEPLAIGATFFLVSLGWPLFYTDLAGFTVVLENLVTPEVWRPHTVGTVESLYVVGALILTFGYPRVSRRLKNMCGQVFRAGQMQVGIILLGALYFQISETFIYFRF